MKKDNIESLSGQTLFVGIDVHKKSFQVTFDCEMSSQLIPASWPALKKLLSPFCPHQKRPVTSKRESRNIPDSHQKGFIELRTCLK